jgi:hypothetical protein
MANVAQQPFSAWGNFYLIVGTAGGALIGIQFVIMTLIASRRFRPAADTLNAFSTPTVVHFGSSLLISALMCTPWPALLPAAVALAACGLLGFGYALIVLRRARRQTLYKPTWDDWLWYTLVPMASNAALAVAGLLIPIALQPALFVIGGVSLVLLLLAIRNAWDSVTHIVLGGADGDAAGPE